MAEGLRVPAEGRLSRLNAPVEHGLDGRIETSGAIPFVADDGEPAQWPVRAIGWFGLNYIHGRSVGQRVVLGLGLGGVVGHY